MEKNVLAIPGLFNYLLNFSRYKILISLDTKTIVGDSKKLNNDVKHDIIVRERIFLHANTKQNNENSSTTVKV